MGVRELREAFNLVAVPLYTCSKALLTYERHNDTEWQRLHFSGIDADGAPFEVRSDALRPDTDVNAAAGQVAQGLVKAKDSENEKAAAVAVPLPDVLALPAPDDDPGRRPTGRLSPDRDL